MSAFDPDPRHRWLFCFTHPDDEIATAAWIRRLARLGAEVWAGWSVSNATRETEARAVMRLLGVSEERLFFFEAPDGDACGHLASLRDQWAEAIRVSNPSRIAVCAFECGHLDHDSTNYAVNGAVRGVGVECEVFEFPLYHTYLTRIPVLNRFADPTGEEVLRLVREEWRLKRTVSRMYPSQNIGSLLVWYTLWGWVRLRPPALCRTERMRRQTHFDFTTPNLPEPLRSRVQRSEKWQRWLRCVQSADSSQ
jgi:LmbE family N-acetylglucosaminyl deacetylase